MSEGAKAGSQKTDFDLIKEAIEYFSRKNEE